MKRKLKAVTNFITGIIVAVALAFSLLLVGPGLLGYKNFIVTSASMEPNIMTGSMIYVDSLDSVNDYKVNDVISFYLDGEIVATHRIIDITESEETECGFVFKTKGDKNDDPDPSPVDPANVIGKCVFTVPYLGYIYTYVRNPPGIYVVITVVMIVLLSMFVPAIFFSDDEDEEQPEKSDKNS